MLGIESTADKFGKKPSRKIRSGITVRSTINETANIISLNRFSPTKRSKKTTGNGFMAVANDRKMALEINLPFVKKYINIAKQMNMIPSKFPRSISDRNGEVRSERIKTFVQFVG
jgi:hypothetical protein